MAIVKIIRARENDTLCGMAVDNGFRDCRKVRAENSEFDTREMQPGDTVNIPEVTPKMEPGQTEMRHRFRRPGRPVVAIRFVHGSANRTVENDETLRVLNVSNYVTDQAGTPDGSAAWVDDNVRVFNADADKDPDTFKIEVTDAKTNANQLSSDLEALKPVYDPADAAGRRILRHESFTPAAEKTKRSQPGIVVERQGAGKRFRSCYLRLVVDEADKAIRARQTLLATDMTAEGDPKIEILDQKVLAAHKLTTCPGPAAVPCRVTARVPIGTDRRRMRVAVHVLRQAVGGAPIVPLADARRRVTRWVRRLYAQAAIGPKLLQVRDVDPMENLVAISNDTGATAANDGPLSFRINAAGKPSQVVGPITPAAGQLPIDTARALAALVRAPYTAVPSLNPPRFPDAIGSADILITEASGARVTIDNEVSGDSRQKLRVGRANPLNLESWNGTNFLVGSLEQRTLLKNYDTGADRIDIIVVQRVTGAGAGDRGQAMMSGHRVRPGKAAINSIKFSAILTQRAMDSSDTNPFSFPHEMGHVALEVVHATGAGTNTQMMTGAGTSPANGVNASKRIRDGRSRTDPDGLVTFDSPAVTDNQVHRIRDEGRSLLENW